MSELDARAQQVADALHQLGAGSEQAKLMARQLVKRAEQLAEQHNSSFLIELGKLLQTVSCGAQGRLKPEDNQENP